MADKKKPDNTHQHYSSKDVSSVSRYAEEIKSLEGNERDYRFRHARELEGEQKEANGFNNPHMVKQAISNYFNFHRGEKTDYTMGVTERGGDREALIQLQKAGVDFAKIDEARKTFPNMTYTQMYDNFRHTHTVDASDYTGRKNAAFDNKVAEALKNHPDADQIADMKEMLVLGDIKESEPKKPHLTKAQPKSTPKPEVTKANEPPKPEDKKPDIVLTDADKAKLGTMPPPIVATDKDKLDRAIILKQHLE